MRFVLPLSACAGVLVVTALGGCGDALSLLPASQENKVDTVVVFAANGTGITQPSGYSIVSRSRIRLDQGNTFDFIYYINSEGRHFFLPVAAIASTGRTTGNAGFQKTDTPFEDILIAQQLGYITNDSIPITPGQTFYARSTVSQACDLGIPFYAKVQVLSIDDVHRGVSFRILSNVNCGYRGLQTGIPKQ